MEGLRVDRASNELVNTLVRYPFRLDVLSTQENHVLQTPRQTRLNRLGTDTVQTPVPL